MRKIQLIIVPVTCLAGHAALALIRKFGKREYREIPVDYKPSESLTLVGINEEEILVLTNTGSLAKRAFQEGISLPRAVAHFITKNENEEGVERFLAKIEKVLASPTATQNFESAVKKLLQTFEPAVAVRAITGFVETIFSLSRANAPEDSYTTEKYGSVRVAFVKKEMRNPFLSALILEKDNVDLVVQNTTSGPQISWNSRSKGLALEVANKIGQQGLLLGTNSMATRIGNTLSFPTRVMENSKFFPTFDHIGQIVRETCKSWSSVTEEVPAL